MPRIIVKFSGKAFKRHSDVEITQDSNLGPTNDSPSCWKYFESGGAAWHAVVENEIGVSPAQFEALNGLIEGGIDLEIDENGLFTVVVDDQ